MTRYIIAFTIIFLSAGASAQQLKQIQKGTANNQIPVTNGKQYTQVYRDAIPYILDTIGIRDSILADVLPDSIFNVAGVSKDTIKLRDGDGFALVDKALVNGVKGTGTATRVAFWNSSSSLSSDPDLYWDNVNSRLGIGNTSPSSALTVAGNSDLNGYLRVNGGNNIWMQAVSIPIPVNAGDQNTLIGFNVGNPSGMTGAINNFLLGANAALSLSTGDNNIVIGQGVMNTVSTGTDNISIGNNSLYNSANTSSTIAIGSFAGQDMTNTYGGTYVGNSAGRASSVYGAAFGEQALRNNSGANSVAFGNLAGYFNSGLNSVFLGHQAGFENSRNQSLFIENSDSWTPLIGGQFDNNRVGINRNISSINATLHVGGDLIVETRSGTPSTGAAFDSSGKLVTTGSTPGSVTSIATTSPITGGPITGTGTIGINDAAADGLTKGASTYTANDFNSSAGLISIDYTNGQAASGTNKGFLTSTDWITFNNKVTTVTASSPLSSSGGTSPNISMTQSGAASNGWLSSANWNTFNNKMDAWGVRTQSGTGGGTIQYLTSYSNVLDFYNGSGITISRPSGTLGITITATDASTTNELQNLSYGTKSGTDIPLDIASGVGVYFREGTGISLGRTASNVMTINSTVTNTDNQTLSFSSPNLSISGGNSVALPVLPSGTTPGNGIRWTGSAWESSTLMSIAANAASTKYFNWNGGNSYLNGTGISTSGNVHLATGGSGVSASRLMGQDAGDALTGVTVGSGLSLSSGTITATDASATNELQTISTSGAAGNITLSGGGGTLNLNVNDADASTTNEGSLTVGAGTSTTSIINSNTSGSTGVTISAGNGLVIVEGGNTIALDTYREYSHVYGVGQDVNTTLSNVQIAQGHVLPVNMTINSSSDVITPGSSSYPYKWTAFGQIYNSSGTPTNVTIWLYRGGTSLYSYESTQITCRDTHTNFSMSGLSDNGTGTFQWKIQASTPPAGTLQLTNFQATVERF